MKNLILILLSFQFSLYAQNDILNNKIDSIISSAIKLNAFPGAQIVVLKDGEETSGVGQFIKYRKFFCDNCVIKKIVKINQQLQELFFIQSWLKFIIVFR